MEHVEEVDGVRRAKNETLKFSAVDVGKQVQTVMLGEDVACTQEFE